MADVTVRSFCSPNVVLLAFDWPDGARHDDFVGFKIERSPGFDGAATSPLPNRISFEKPEVVGQEVGSDKAPIQKFLWWDARVDPSESKDKLSKYRYTVTPMIIGANGALKPGAASSSVDV